MSKWVLVIVGLCFALGCQQGVTDVGNPTINAPVPASNNDTDDQSSPSPGTSECTAICDGKQCGDDGCGGSCGNCEEGKICSTENKCVEKPKVAATITTTNFQVTDELIVTNGVMQTATGETPKVTVKSDVPLKSVYVVCGSNVPPYQIQKFVLSAEPNDTASYVLAVSDVKPEISASPKFACTTIVLDADGNFQFLKLKIVTK